MTNANIAGSLKIKNILFFSSNFTFYKWCVTKVAHCIYIFCVLTINRICGEDLVPIKCIYML